ncbi:hypothetical protein HD554DRAFT_2042125 [Boletus coccyginus]|nr:hypothetical protein HD554DRAFT_2042125 [Boletus coccyginus]
MVTTRKENATKCVAQPVLAAKRKRRTKAEIEADKQRIEEERQNAEQVHRAGLERIANIQGEQALEEVRAKVGAKPRPRLRLVQPVPNRAIVTVDEGERNDEELQPEREVRRTKHRDAVGAMRQLEGQDVAAGTSDTRGSDDKKGSVTNRQGDDAKETFLGHMDKWITDVAKSGKPKRTPQRITCSSNAASSVQISAFSNVTATSRTSYSSAPKPPPSRSPTPSSVGPEDELPAVLLDDDDTVEREAAHSLMNLHQLPPPSKDKDIDFSQPPFTQIPRATPIKAEPVDVPMDVAIAISDSGDDPIIIDNDFKNVPPSRSAPVAIARSSTSRKRTTTLVADHSDAPSSKRSRTKPASQDGTAIENVKKVKYNNSHLPLGAMTDNKWRGVLIPTYAKWNGMLSVCWGTKSSYEVEVLQLLWDIIYKRRIPAIIQCDDAIYTVATQRVAEWRGGFASASISMICSLIKSDEKFNSPGGQRAFANFWLEGNRFLFKDVSGNSVKDYRGMWKSAFIVQTLAAHIHFIQGAIDMPFDTGLKDKKHRYPRAALSLAGTAVKRMLILLRDDALTFELIPPSGKGKKKANGNEKWKANITSDMFKKDLWGHESARFMDSIEAIPPTVWDEIVEAADQFVEETMRKRARGSSSEDDEDDNANACHTGSDDDDEFTDLMTYR